MCVYDAALRRATCPVDRDHSVSPFLLRHGSNQLYSLGPTPLIAGVVERPGAGLRPVRPEPRSPGRADSPTRSANPPVLPPIPPAVTAIARHAPRAHRPGDCATLPTAPA